MTDTPAIQLPAEVVDKMSPADKLDYTRKFDQSKMPAWRDPRADEDRRKTP